MMAYLSQFRKVTPKRNNADRLVLDCYLLGIKVGKKVCLTVVAVAVLLLYVVLIGFGGHMLLHFVWLLVLLIS